MPADPGNEKPKSDVLAENTRSATVRTCSPSRVELWGAMRGTVRIAPGTDLTQPTGEIWDANR